ncbi:phospholipase B1, membrane-associated-like [Leptopilina boulardi]|uniref:phospholipase B1, membrane-associated-like n=1 Tax=Leptopilina boulardi TaxID=63433 RepID=UPI0021F504AF|nr:phospholipase B1, membrane-associated-like [Leptopilina boulardi]
MISLKIMLIYRNNIYRCTLKRVQETKIINNSLLWVIDSLLVYTTLTTAKALNRFYSSASFILNKNELGRYYKDAEKAGILQPRIPDNVPFPCNLTGARSKKVPSSIHKLRPGDIDVIGAIGDSITAGMAMLSTNPIHLFLENRGSSAIGGGQNSWRKYLTLPNILKEFNPNLIGYSQSDSFEFDASSEFNVAEAAAFSINLPTMSRTLIEKMKNHSKVVIKKHWKMISIFIGSNDFCTLMCYLPSPWSILKNHKKNLIQALRLLRDNLPRTFVNLILPPNLKIISFMRERLLCDLYSKIVCSCLFGQRWLKRREEFFDIMTRYQEIEKEVAQYSEFQTENFTVVAQPFLVNLTLPSKKSGSIDLSFLANDCFHLSQKSNARAAVAIWNNLMEQEGQKSMNWGDTFKRFICPTVKRPYFATWKNSRK